MLTSLFRSITINYFFFFFVSASVVPLTNKSTVCFLFSIFNNVSRFNYENQRNSKLIFRIYLFKKHSYLYQWQILNNFICHIGNWSICFFLLSFSPLFFFSFSFIIIIDYCINPFTNIWNVAFYAERLNTGGKNEKKKKKWCMYWFFYIDALEQLRERIRFISVRFEFIWGHGLWNFSKGFDVLNSASLTLYHFIADILVRNVS